MWSAELVGKAGMVPGQRLEKSDPARNQVYSGSCVAVCVVSNEHYRCRRTYTLGLRC